jgi:hypothetical protein
MNRSSILLLSSAAVAGAVIAGPGAAPAAAQASRKPLYAPRPAAPARYLGHIPGSMDIPQPEPLITYKGKRQSLGRILRAVFAQTPYEYQVLAELGNQLYDLDVARVPLTKVLQALLAQDPGQEPLVFSFKITLAGRGTFTVDREYIDVGMVNGENRVSLANARLTKVLPLIFEKMGVQHRIEPDVPPILLSLQLRPDAWEEALPQVMLEAYKQEPTITYSIDNGTYVVHLQKTPTGEDLNIPVGSDARRVKLTAAQTPLSAALAQFFQGSSWKYELSSKVRDVRVTTTLNGEPEFGALRKLLKAAAANGAVVTYREGKGVVYIEPGPLPGQEVKVARDTSPQAIRKTSLAPVQQRISEAARLLAEATGTTVRLAPGVPDIPVTFKVQDATIEQALQALVDAGKKSLPNLSFRSTAQGIYVISLGAGR